MKVSIQMSNRPPLQLIVWIRIYCGGTSTGVQQLGTRVCELSITIHLLIGPTMGLEWGGIKASVPQVDWFDIPRLIGVPQCYAKLLEQPGK